jgi:hypothetical protein
LSSSALAPHATHIAELLLESMPAYLSEDSLALSTGLPGYGVRWYIFHLRQAGYVVEAAQFADLELFRQGTRGWKLTDILETPFVPQNQDDVDGMAEVTVDLQTDVAALALLVAKTRRAAKRRPRKSLPVTG